MDTVGIRNSKLLVRSEVFGEYPKHYPTACWFVALKVWEKDGRASQWHANVYTEQSNALQAYDSVIASGEAESAVSGYWLGSDHCEFYPSFSGKVNVMDFRWTFLVGDLERMAAAVEAAGRRAVDTIKTK